jgi:isoleucyl-tRNA synthetase
VRKDALYCDRPDDLTRRAARTVLDHLHRCLTTWLAPVLCFTAEEAWSARFGEEGSVHLQQFPALPAAWRDAALGTRWDRIRDIRRVITGALERARADGLIRASLQAKPVVYLDNNVQQMLPAGQWAELAIVSDIEFALTQATPGAFRLAEVEGVAAHVSVAPGNKCARCWKVLPEVGQHATHPSLCARCVDAVESGLVCKAAE